MNKWVILFHVVFTHKKSTCVFSSLEKILYGLSFCIIVQETSETNRCTEEIGRTTQERGRCRN
jgi:hypothetical protein